MHRRIILELGLFIIVAIPAFSQAHIFTSTATGTTVNGNIYTSKDDVYLSGGPQNCGGSGLPDGTYYFQVTNPSTAVLLSSDPASDRVLTVSGGIMTSITPSGPTPHNVSASITPCGAILIQLQPFADTTNPGSEYKVTVVSTSCASVDGTGFYVTAPGGCYSKTDNFKIRGTTSTCAGVVLAGICYPTSALLGSKFYDAVPLGGGAGAEDSPIPGWTIHLTGALPDTTTFDYITTTDGSGEYGAVFAVGTTYSICEVQQTSYTQTYPTTNAGCYSGTVGGTDITNLDFGNTIKMTGVKHYDTTGSGTGTGLSGWTINIICTGGTGTCPASVTTNGTGTYVAYATAPITSYTVCEGSKTDYSQTSPNGTTIPTNGATVKTDCAAPNSYGWAGTIGTASGLALDFGNVSYVTGTKYYDLDANGQPNSGEPTISGFKIGICFDSGCPSTVTYVYTDVNGNYKFFLPTPTSKYVLQEFLPVKWAQTGPLPGTIVGVAKATSLKQWSTFASLTPGPQDGLYFTNVCFVTTGALTMGWYKNAGNPTITNGDLGTLDALNLSDGAGTNNFNPSTTAAIGRSQVKTWLGNATATNMGYMLSAQLAVMQLNVDHGFITTGVLIYAPGTISANAAGFATLGAVMAEANTLLGTDGIINASDPNRRQAGALETALDNANNNRNIVGGPGQCPPPTTAY